MGMIYSTILKYCYTIQRRMKYGRTVERGKGRCFLDPASEIVLIHSLKGKGDSYKDALFSGKEVDRSYYYYYTMNNGCCFFWAAAWGCVMGCFGGG